MAEHSRRRSRPPTRVLVLLGIVALLLALVVALGMMAAPRPDPRPAGIRLTPPRTAPLSSTSMNPNMSGEFTSTP